MFLHELTREQQRAFMILAREVVAADDRLALQEVERLDLLYREMQLPAADAGAPEVALDLNYHFATPRARALVVLNLLLLGYADGALDEREETAARRTAEALDLDEAAWARLADWAWRYHALVGEIDGLLL